MKASVDRRYVSVLLVLCMIAATMAIMLVANPVKGVAYQQPFAFKDGEQDRESFARSMALLDLDADGIADLVAGAPYATISSMKNAGSVRVYLSNGGPPLSKTVYINGTHGGDSFGWAVANVGDVNGDGKDDLAVGAPYADPGTDIDAGNVTLFYGWSGFSGKANVSINSANAGEGFGYALSAAGDVDGDTIDDMIVGAPYYSSATVTEIGRAYIFYGGSSMDSTADKTFTGDAANGHFGLSVSGNANVDNDASMDMIVGAPDEVSAGAARGAAHIFRNLDRVTPQTSVVRGAATNDKFGYCVMMINDIDGDTFDDIAIGAPYNDENGTDAGEVSILYGGAKFNDQVDLVLMGQAPNELFGFSIASGDFRKDSYCDLVVGAPNSSLNATMAGRAYVFYGSSTPSAHPSVIIVPETGSNFLGGSAAVGGNVTGDSARDFAVGDPQFNLPGLPNAGRAYVYAGVTIVTPENPWVWGYVYNNTSVGLQGFTVTLKSQSTSFSKSITTTANGSYGIGKELTAVPGTYWLNASKSGYVLNSTTITLVMDQVKRQDFYPDTVPIVWGVITELPATAIRGTTVAMYNGTTFIQSAVTPANGTYWMTVPTAFIPAAGSQTDLRIEAWDGTHYLNWKNVTVRRSDTKQVNIQLDLFPYVTGVIRDAVTSSAVRGATIVADQGGVVRGTATSDLRGNYNLTAVNATAPGPLYLNVTAPGYWNDSATVAVAKNTESTQDFFLLSDTTPPTSSITTTLQSYTNTTVIALDATANDDQGIKEVQLWYRRGGSGNYLLYGSDQTSPYSFAFNTGTTGGDGLYEFYTRAVDLASNVEAAPAANDTWTYVDAHVPVLSITAPTEGQVFATSTVAVTWTGSDTGSGILWYRVQLDSGAWVDKGTATSHSFTSVADGAHRINVTASDKALLETTKTVNVTVDTTDAASQVNALPTYTTVADFVVTATASDPTGIQEVQLWYRFGGAGAFVYFGRDTTSPYTFQFNTSNIQGDDLYEFYSKAIDGAGHNESAPAGNDTWTIVDTAAPTLSITAPTAGQTVSTADATVNWTGSDPVSGIASFKTRVDGGSWVDRGTSLSATLTSLADGNHTTEVNATDRAGHSKLASVTFRVDTVAPVVLITAPTNNSALSSASITLQWSASDVGSGIETLQVSSDGLAWESVDVNSTERVFYGPSGFPEGDYTLYVRAADHGGLTTTATVRTVLDRTDPTVTITSPRPDQKVKDSNVTIGWAMLDTGSGVSQVRISIDGGAFMSLGSATSYDIATLADGKHNVTVRVTDRAGNYAEATVEFTISTGGGISSIMMGAIALVIIVTIVAGVLLMKRKKGPVPEKKEPGK